MRNARFLALILALLVALLIYFSANEHAADKEGNSRVQHSERQQDLTANQTIQGSELSTAKTRYEETSSALPVGPATNEGLFEKSYDDFLTPDVGDDPAQYILLTLDLANSGDPAAMYELSTIYGYCGSRPDDPEKALAATLDHNEQRYSDGEISEVHKNSLNARFSMCETIWKVMPPEQVDWFARAKDGRLPIQIDIEKCERCSGPVRVIASIEDTDVGRPSAATTLVGREPIRHPSTSRYSW